jgi:hypothetical protein
MTKKSKKKQELEQKEVMSEKDAKEKTKEVAELLKENIKNFWEISKRLREIRDKEGYIHFGCKTYEEYSQKIFEIARRTAQAYIQAREYMEKYHLAHAHAHVEPQKVLLLSRLDSKEYEEERKRLDKKVFNEGMSWRDLEGEIRKIRGKGEDWLRFLDVWNFKENTGEGLSNLPPEVLKNLFYYYTKEGDKIFDCFAGSGQTYKIAYEMGRECICSDINPQEDFIIKWDVDEGFDNFPEDLSNLKMVFLDPPYFDMVNYGEGWSNTSLNEFYKKFDRFVGQIDSIMDKETHIALIIMPLKKEGEYIDLGFECYKILESKFKIVQRLCVPLMRNWSFDPRIKKSKDNKEILTGSLRDLIIFKKSNSIKLKEVKQNGNFK